MTRHEQMRAGKIWQVSQGEGEKEKIIFEGSESACRKWMREKGIYAAWRRGRTDYHLGQLIWEAE